MLINYNNNRVIALIFLTVKYNTGMHYVSEIFEYELTLRDDSINLTSTMEMQFTSSRKIP